VGFLLYVSFVWIQLALAGALRVNTGDLLPRRLKHLQQNDLANSPKLNTANVWKTRSAIYGKTALLVVRRLQELVALQIGAG
jgi:hypothetical protein